MAYLNTSPPTSRAVLQISTATISTTSSGYVVPALQDITVNNANGEFRWQQLDNVSELVVPTVSSNSISGNMVLDPTTFFTGSAGVPGLFDLAGAKTKVYFRVYFNGTGVAAKFAAGSGYVTALAPSVSPGAPVWVSPVTVSVDGELTIGTV